MIPRSRLAAYVQRPVERSQRTPYPTAADVLYVGPNPDETRKSCASCYKFIATNACIEVAGDVQPEMVCGLNVFGTPQPAMPAVGRPDVRMTAEEAGLVMTPGGLGSSCDNCRFFTGDEAEPEIGICSAVGSADGEPPIVVDALGCCARWREFVPIEVKTPSLQPERLKLMAFGHAPAPDAIDIDADG